MDINIIKFNDCISNNIVSDPYAEIKYPIINNSIKNDIPIINNSIINNSKSEIPLKKLPIYYKTKIVNTIINNNIKKEEISEIKEEKIDIIEDIQKPVVIINNNIKLLEKKLFNKHNNIIEYDNKIFDLNTTYNTSKLLLDYTITNPHANISVYFKKVNNKVVKLYQNNEIKGIDKSDTITKTNYYYGVKI